jgi:sugar phosphate isomerase/epimerase
MSGQARLTLLNDMAGTEFTAALDRQLAWNVRDLDLRTAIYGHSVNDLPVELATRAAEEIARREMRVFALSTGLLVDDVALGPDETRRRAEARLASALPAAAVLKPRFVRLLAGQWSERPAAPHGVDGLRRSHPWIFDAYRRVSDTIAEAGFTPILENEATRCFLSHPAEIAEFLDEVDHPALRLTWDVQNQWATGVYPRPEHLDLLAPRLSYLHLKGARSAEDDPERAAWNVALEDSDWPVLEITQAVVDRSLSEVICLNPSQHGAAVPGYDYATVVERDLGYLRRHVRGLS